MKKTIGQSYPSSARPKRCLLQNPPVRWKKNYAANSRDRYKSQTLNVNHTDQADCADFFRRNISVIRKIRDIRVDGLCPKFVRQKRQK